VGRSQRRELIFANEFEIEHCDIDLTESVLVTSLETSIGGPAEKKMFAFSKKRLRFTRVG
jgi:hypothetical protein